MKTRARFSLRGKALCCLGLFPGLLVSQMPEKPGRLTVESTPAGATVTIDQQQMGRRTPYTFVVSPGQHSLSVRGKDEAGKEIDCQASLYIGAGAARSVHCTARGWEPPVK